VARTFDVFLDPARGPDRAALQLAINRLGFKLTLDDGYQPATHQGYLPCTLEGEDAGVDLRFTADAALPGSAQALSSEQGSRRLCARLKWSGDAREHLSALLIVVALAQDFDALVIDPDKGTQPATQDLLKQARALHEDSF